MKKNKSASIIILNIILILAIIILGFCGYSLFCTYNNYKEEQNYWAQIETNAITIKENVAANSESTAEKTFADNTQVLYSYLLNINSDCVGYIIIPGTKVSYPIVKSKDNKDYLDISFDKAPNHSGSIFMDYRCNSDFNDVCTIIYGHNMKDGSMFRTLNEYVAEDYYLNHKQVLISTKTTNSFKTYNIISAYITTQDDLETYRIDFTDSADYTDFLSLIKNKSLYDTGIDIDNTKRVILLSTCRGNNNSRFVVWLQESN